MSRLSLHNIKSYFGRKLLRSTNPSSFSDFPTASFGIKHLDNCKNLPTREDMIDLLPHNGVVAEIGVNRGEFSDKILKINKPQKLHLIDMWSSKRYHGGIRQIVEDKFKGEIESKQIELNLGMSTAVIPTLPNEYFDWVYVDTDHLYENTAKELELLHPKMKKNGVIAGHDYIIGNWNGVVRYGVIEAVREFCLKYNWELIYLTHELDIYPSFAIKRISDT